MKKIKTSSNIFEKRHVFIFSSIIFKIILEYTYINFVNQIFEYRGFNLNISALKYLESWLIFFLFLSFTTHKLEHTSDFIINTLFFLFLSPLLVFYSLSNAMREYFYIVLLGISIIYLFRNGKKIKLPVIKQGKFLSLLICIVGVVLVSLWMIFSGGLNYFNLDQTKIYELRRSVNSVINVGLMSYLNSWAYTVFGPFLLAIFLNNRMYFFTILIFLIYLFWFGVSSHKAVILYPFVVLFVYLWFKNNKGLSVIPISLTLVIFFSYMSYFIFDEYLYSSLFIRRVFFTPSYLTFVYYEFFSNEGFIFWSNSITSKFIDYPFNLSPANLIGDYLETGSHSNSSFLSTGYMHAGIIGIILYSIIFSLILRLFDGIGNIYGSVWFPVASIIIPIRSVILSADLPTGLLTHGVLLTIIILGLYKRKPD